MPMSSDTCRKGGEKGDGSKGAAASLLFGLYHWLTIGSTPSQGLQSRQKLSISIFEQIFIQKKQQLNF